MPSGCHLVNKTAKNKAVKTATSRANTDFLQMYPFCIHSVSIPYTYRIHTVYTKKKEKKKAERKEAKERVKNKDK
nr:MAG TPA: hypothetical protein [Bacteriophage sp.]